MPGLEAVSTARRGGWFSTFGVRPGYERGRTWCGFLVQSPDDGHCRNCGSRTEALNDQLLHLAVRNLGTVADSDSDCTSDEDRSKFSVPLRKSHTARGELEISPVRGI